MTKTEYNIPGNSELKMVNGQVINIPTQADNRVTLELYGHLRTVDIDWLEKLCKNCILLPEGYGESVMEIEFHPYDMKSHGVDWDHIAVFRKPVWYKLDRSYRLVAMFPDIAVNAKGDIINVASGNKFPINSDIKSDKHYPMTSILDRRKKVSVNYRRHRLVAMAWLPNDDFIHKPMADHIDGKKWNCNVSNLRWVSFSENNEGATLYGGKPDAMEVQVMDYDTKVITLFKSATKACAFMGRSLINGVAEYCKTPMLIKNRYQIKLADDSTPWDFTNGNGNYATTIDGVVRRFKTITLLLDELLPELNRATSGARVKKALRSKYPGVIINFPEKKYPSTGPFQALFKDRNDIVTVNTINELVNVTGLSKSCIRKYMTYGPEYSFKGISVRRYTDDPWPICDKIRGIYMESFDIENVSTGEKHHFESGRKTADFVGVDKKTIVKYKGTGKAVNGYYIK